MFEFEIVALLEANMNPAQVEAEALISPREANVSIAKFIPGPLYLCKNLGQKTLVSMNELVDISFCDRQELRKHGLIDVCD